MTTKTKQPADPDLALSDAEVDALVSDAQRTAQDAAAALAAAEAVVRGEIQPEAKAKDITPARLAELRAEAAHAELSIDAAQRRTDQIRDKQAAALIAATLDRIKTEAATDLSGGEALVAKLDAFQSALSDLFTAFGTHNDAVTRWAAEMAGAGVPRSDVGRGPDGMTWTAEGEVRIEGKDYRPLKAAQFVGAALFRVTEGMPPGSVAYDGRDLVHRDWVEGSFGSFEWTPVDLRARIRRDA